jgi:hypothetical protein
LATILEPGEIEAAARAPPGRYHAPKKPLTSGGELAAVSVPATK